MSSAPQFTVSEFVTICNQILEYSFSSVVVEGEVASFKVNQGKWVFFDLKEGDCSINCFMSVYQLTAPIADGMKVRVRATPKLTAWGKFSLTVQRIMPMGEGNIKKSFELLKQKLTKEGLFAPERKRPLPRPIRRIGVISSTQAAGYVDFLKILNARWGGLQVITAHTQVQGLGAAEQIIRAINYFNQYGQSVDEENQASQPKSHLILSKNTSNDARQVDVIAIIRGGGSADDLAVFNDEELVRAVAASRIPVITGIGHEVDESLVDLAVDLRASTPSNVAELLTPDRQAVRAKFRSDLGRLGQILRTRLSSARAENRTKVTEIGRTILQHAGAERRRLQSTQKLLASLSPEAALRRGYAILDGKISPGSELMITTVNNIITTEVKNVQNRFN